MLIILTVGLYAVGYFFDWLPEEYAPHMLMPQEYKKLKRELRKDSISTDSSTAKFSKLMYNVMDTKEKYYDKEREKEKQKQEEAARAKEDGVYGNPMEKTKELMQQMKERNKILEEEL